MARLALLGHLLSSLLSDFTPSVRVSALGTEAAAAPVRLQSRMRSAAAVREG